jgi:hypothetical protein
LKVLERYTGTISGYAPPLGTFREAAAFAVVDMKSIDENAPSRGSVSVVDVALAVSVMVASAIQLATHRAVQHSREPLPVTRRSTMSGSARRSAASFSVALPVACRVRRRATD